MGYLDNSSVTVDAILTNKGRQILAAGGQLNIVKFALSDDEIDYDLWNPAHTLGTNYYGSVIENMPVLEGLPDESQMMRYKLVTLPKSVIGIPVISIPQSAISFTALNQSQTVTPTTINMDGANQSLGYTAILSDNTVANLTVSPTGQIPGVDPNQASNTSVSVTTFIDDEATGITTAGTTLTRVGRQFVITPVAQADTTTIRRALLTIIGNETGGFKTISITVDPTNFNTQNVITAAPLIDR